MVALVVCAGPAVGEAAISLLKFDEPVQAMDVSDIADFGVDGYIGVSAPSAMTLKFRNVTTVSGKAVNARVSAVEKANTGFWADYSNPTFAEPNNVPNAGGGRRGFIPDYDNATTGEPSGDLGVIYDGLGLTVSGLTITIDFFDGTSGDGFSTPIEIPNYELLIYDVDGENANGYQQDEYFTAFGADGLSSYEAGSGMTATVSGGDVTFLGPQFNYDEVLSPASVLLRYDTTLGDTSSVTLDYGSEQFAHGIDDSYPNFVFFAIDGSQLVTVQNVVPEPSTILIWCLLGLLGAMFGWRRGDRGRRR
jgi:hypothetical protein